MPLLYQRWHRCLRPQPTLTLRRQVPHHQHTGRWGRPGTLGAVGERSRSPAVDAALPQSPFVTGLELGRGRTETRTSPGWSPKTGLGDGHRRQLAAGKPVPACRPREPFAPDVSSGSGVQLCLAGLAAKTHPWLGLGSGTSLGQICLQCRQATPVLASLSSSRRPRGWIQEATAPLGGIPPTPPHHSRAGPALAPPSCCGPANTKAVAGTACQGKVPPSLQTVKGWWWGGELLPSVPLNDASLNGRSSRVAGWLPGAALGRCQWALPGAASVQDAPPEPSPAQPCMPVVAAPQ